MKSDLTNAISMKTYNISNDLVEIFIKGYSKQEEAC